MTVMRWVRRLPDVVKMFGGLLVVAMLTAGASSSCDDELGDRSSATGAGRRADRVADARDVVVYRNIDDFPNLARVCLDGYAFVVTSSRDGTVSPAVVRLPEADGQCAR